MLKDIWWEQVVHIRLQIEPHKKCSNTLTFEFRNVRFSNVQKHHHGPAAVMWSLDMLGCKSRHQVALWCTLMCYVSPLPCQSVFCLFWFWCFFWSAQEKWTILQAPTGVGRGMLTLRRHGPLNDGCRQARAFSLARGLREKAFNSCFASIRVEVNWFDLDRRLSKPQEKGDEKLVKFLSRRCFGPGACHNWSKQYEYMIGHD